MHANPNPNAIPCDKNIWYGLSGCTSESIIMENTTRNEPSGIRTYGDQCIAMVEGSDATD